jgi:hypothetical protein
MDVGVGGSRLHYCGIIAPSGVHRVVGPLAYDLVCQGDCVYMYVELGPFSYEG